MKKYGFGVDVGGTTCKIGLFDMSGVILEKWEIKTNTENNGASILDDVAASVLGKMEEKNIDKEDVQGIGLGVPGPVDNEGVVHKCVNLGWDVVNVEKELEEKKKEDQTVNISEYSIDSSSDFDTEEFVRDIFVSGEDIPDVLVCMDEVVTECVYQALVDYNQVGNVDIVGFYYSDVILDAISKGIISSAIALDMDEIGRYSINALEEFSSLGHTSNYYSVGQHVITRSNVGTYRTEGDK